MDGSSGAVARYAEAIIFDLLGFKFWMLLSLFMLEPDDNSSLPSLS